MNDIRLRHITLQGAQETLLNGKELLEKQLDDKKAEVTKFEKTMLEDAMSLGNQIASLTKEYDQKEM